jgi:hypothetical protein
MYTDENASPAELRTRFGIGYSSLYRLLRKQGVALRARWASAPEAPDVGKSRLAAAPRTSRPGRARSNSGKALPTAPARRSANGASFQFRVTYKAVQIVQSVDIRDALHQAETVGATDVFEIQKQV